MHLIITYNCNWARSEVLARPLQFSRADSGSLLHNPGGGNKAGRISRAVALHCYIVRCSLMYFVFFAFNYDFSAFWWLQTCFGIYFLSISRRISTLYMQNECNILTDDLLFDDHKLVSGNAVGYDQFAFYLPHIANPLACPCIWTETRCLSTVLNNQDRMPKILSRMRTQGKTTNSSAVGFDHVYFDEEDDSPAQEHTLSQRDFTNAIRQAVTAKEPYRSFNVFKDVC
jgi:hypothetical protein